MTKASLFQANETSLPVDVTGWDKGFGDVRSISTAVPKASNTTSLNH